MTPRIQDKITNAIRFAINAFQQEKNNFLEDTLTNCRKACEAICRAIILKQFGDINGEKIILGEIDINMLPKRTNRSGEHDIPLLSALLKICKPHIPISLYYRFEDVRFGGNNSSHDPLLEKNEITPDDVELCIAQFKEILKWFWNDFFIQPIPLEVQEAFQGKIDENFLLSPENSNWDSFYTTCNYFSSEQKFVLIAPPNYNIPENQLSIFSRIRWDFVFDFNTNSRESGLYKAVESELLNQQIRSITIEQNKEKNLLVGYSNYNINWFFANGIISIPSSISQGEKSWRRDLKYPELITRLVKEYVNLKVQNITIVCLWNEIHFIRPIIQAFDENISNQGLLNYCITYDNIEKLNRLEEEFESYDAKLFNISIAEIAEGIRKTIISKNVNLKKHSY